MITSAQTLHSSLQGHITNRKRTWQHWSATLLLFVLNEWMKERALNCCDLNAVWLCQLFIEEIFALWPQLPQYLCVQGPVVIHSKGGFKVTMKLNWKFFMEHCSYYDLLIRAHHYFIKFMCPYFLIKITFTTFCSNILNSLMMCLLV